MSINKFKNLFGSTKAAVIAMVHVQALPGSPGNKLNMNEITSLALKEAEIYVNSGVDGIMVENMHDVPYQNGNRIDYGTVTAMASLTTSIRSKFPKIPLGVQILKAGNHQALAVAKTTGCDFIRAEGFVFSHISDAGFVDGCAGDLLRYRKYLDAEDMLILTDIKKKHSSHAITNDVASTATAYAAEFFKSDGIIVTGSETGKEASKVEVDVLSENLPIPVIVGSGITHSNVHSFMNADGFIVGSYFKQDGVWSNPVDATKVINFMEHLKHLRNNEGSL